MKARYKACLIGTGSIANTHLDNLKQQPDAIECVAVSDVDHTRVEAFAAKHEVSQTYTDVDAMLSEQKPDFVIICTPPAFHVDLSIQAMEAGAWVLCEKPLCASLAEMDRLMEAEERTGQYTASIFQWRYGSGSQHLGKLIREEALGRVLAAMVNTTWFRGKDYYEVDWRGTWKSELGGPTMGHGIHAMDLFFSLMGPWTEVKAMVGTLDRDIEVEDVSTALVRFESGAMATIMNSVLSPREESYLRFDFQEATVEARNLYAFDNDDFTFTRRPNHGLPEGEDPVQKAWDELSENERSTHAAQFRHVALDRDANRRPATSGVGVRRTFELLTALYKSALSDKTVRAGEIGPGDPFYTSIHGEMPIPSDYVRCQD